MTVDPTVPAGNVDEGVKRPTLEGGAAICYRMEPSKQMLSRAECSHSCTAPPSADGNRMPPCLLSAQTHTVIDLDQIRRVALMVTPQGGGDVIDQAWEAISTVRAVLKQQARPMAITVQTIFLRRAEDAEPCRRLLQAYYGERMPATNFVAQPPCGGEALAIEAWGLGGEGVDIQFPQPDVATVAYDGLRWTYLGGITASSLASPAYPQAKSTLDAMAGRLERVGASLQDVVRTWLYVGGITESEQGTERYRELNRARTDFFSEQEAQGRMVIAREGGAFYPASTGIGTAGRGLTVSCMALQTQRADVRLQPLENPWQTSAFQYAQSFSAKSPKFCRAMAVVLGDYVTTWISGTASIVNSESVHVGDVERQTQQTIDNIEHLIGPENFERHGLEGAGAQLRDLAKIRVYVKRPEDYEKCRAICERRFGPLPAVYAQADVCRSDLLVEIEGVAFSRLGQGRSDPQEARHG